MAEGDGPDFLFASSGAAGDVADALGAQAVGDGDAGSSAHSAPFFRASPLPGGRGPQSSGGALRGPRARRARRAAGLRGAKRFRPRTWKRAALDVWGPTEGDPLQNERLVLVGMYCVEPVFF